MKKSLSAFLATILLAGCGSAGKNFSNQDATSIRNGMTKEEVVQKMGSSPNAVKDGGNTFVWAYAEKGLVGGFESKAVAFKFDAAGKTYGIPDNGVHVDTMTSRNK